MSRQKVCWDCNGCTIFLVKLGSKNKYNTQEYRSRNGQREIKMALVRYTSKGEWARKTRRGNRRDDTLIEQHLKSKKDTHMHKDDPLIL